MNYTGRDGLVSGLTKGYHKGVFSDEDLRLFVEKPEGATMYITKGEYKEITGKEY